MASRKTSKTGDVKKASKLSVKKERVRVKKEAAAVKKEALLIKKEEPVESGLMLADPSNSSGSSSAASSSLNQAQSTIVEEDVKLLVKKDEAGVSDDDHDADELVVLPEEEGAALPSHLQHAYVQYGPDAFQWPIPECIRCKSDQDVQERIIGINAYGQVLTLWFCRDHDPLRSLHKAGAIKRYRRYKAQGGNLTNDDLLDAEQKGLLEVRYRRNPHTRSGQPPMRLYYVEDLERLRLIKQDQKATQDREKQERKAAEKRQKEEERAAKKAEAERLRAQKKKEKAEAARARRGEAQSTDAATQAAASLATDEAAAIYENMAVPSGTATVETYPYFNVDESDDGGAQEEERHLPFQNPPSGNADVFPGSSVSVTSTFVEAGEEAADEDVQDLKPGVKGDDASDDADDVTISAQSPVHFTVKEERN